ncbi:MAG: SPFH domain-containing protein, partial [bacterium]|nr:SPFH domain-containing protein [bacterium]
VRESQVAVFFRDGKALDVFGPGRYVLQTQNIPIITKWVTSFGYGPQSPFRAEVYFLNMKLFPNLKWGTRDPILFKDTELDMIRLRAHGIFSIQISEPSLFLNKVVGTQGVYTDSKIDDYLRNIVVSRLTDVFGKEIKTAFDIPRDFDRLSLAIKANLQLDFDGLGLLLHDFFINSVSVPLDVQEMIDARSGMAAVGNMNDFMKFKAAKALQSAAENQGGAASNGVGLGAGLGMGLMLPQYLMDATKKTVDENVPSITATERIRKLKELLDIGAITQEEFQSKKSKFLSEL